MRFDRRSLLKILVLGASTALVSIVAFFLAKPEGWFKSESKPETTVSAVGEKISLPSPRMKSTVSVEEAIRKRRSRRNYSSEPLKIEELSNLLWAAQGITDPANRFRAAPSAGATYPLEVYVVVKKGGVEELSEGVYHYDPFEHSLEKRLDGDLSSDLCSAAVSQGWVRDASINIVLAAVYERTTQRYGERGVRYVHMEVGHVGENLYLQAESLGLGTVVIGAFYDDWVQKLLGLPENQKPLYIIPVGRVTS